MARKQFDNVRHLITTPGDGDITLGSVPDGWRGFAAAGAVDGDMPDYELRQQNAWEIGTLTLANGVTTATRTVTSSSNNDEPIELDGTAVLTCSPVARVVNDDLVSFVRQQLPSPVMRALARANLGVSSIGDLLMTAASADEARQSLEVAKYGVRNRLLNPCGEVAQEALGARTDGQYDFDQWITLAQSGGVTVSVVNDPEDGVLTMMRTLQAQATAQRIGRIQWVESQFCRDLRGKKVAFTARVRMSVSTKLRYAVVAWSGTANAIHLDSVADWTSSTLTPGNFFYGTTTSVVAIGSVDLTANVLSDLPVVSGTVPSAMNNLAVMVWTDSAQAQNVTLDTGNFGLYEGQVAPRFSPPDPDRSLEQCKRYFQTDPLGTVSIFSSVVNSGTGYYHSTMFSPELWAPPTVSFGVGPSYGNFPTQAPTDAGKSTRGLRVAMVANGNGGGYFTYTWKADARLKTV